jgi:signal transduction histidine kinase
MALIVPGLAAPIHCAVDRAADCADRRACALGCHAAAAVFSRIILEMNTSKPSPGDDARCLAAVMLASSAEIYLIDGATLRLVDANAAACSSLQYDIDSLRSMTLRQIAPELSREQLDDALANAVDGVGQLQAQQRRSDSSRYWLTLRLTRSGPARIVAIGTRTDTQAGAAAPIEPSPGHLEPLKEQERILERNRIARDIHDDLGGNLTALKMALAMLSRSLPAEHPQLQQRAAYLDALIDRSIDAVHRIVLDLRPGVLDFGIVAAIEWQIKEFEAQSGVHCVLRSSPAEIELDPDQSAGLFRMFQEALTNIAKHAKASRITVSLARMRHHVSLKITDNGRGMAASDRAKPASFGLRAMMERAQALKGSVTLSANAGGGTTVAIKIALSAQHSAQRTGAATHDVHRKK